MKRKRKLILGIIQLIVALGALPAGYLMISKPDGSGMGMSVDILSGSPFKNFLIPGIFLFTVNGLLNLTSSILSFYKYRYASILGLGLGISLLIWVSVQLYSIGLTHILQPVYFVIGLIEILLSSFILKDDKLFV